MEHNDAKTLNLYPIDYPFETLVDRVKKGRLILNPDFQREYKWDRDGNERGSKFIESALMRIPLPACYFAEDDNGAHLVIDGVQRITTIEHFFENKFRLEGLTVYPELNGMFYSDLGKYKSELETTTIRCIVLRKENQKGLVQEIFARLNQGSVILSPQEIRHAIYPGPLDSLLLDLAKRQEVMTFKKGIGKNAKPKDARESEELVLRYFALEEDESLNAYDNNMSKFLDGYMLRNRDVDESKVIELRRKFNQAMENCLIVFGEKAFKNLAKEGSRQSASLWDLQMVELGRYRKEDIVAKKADIFNRFKTLCENQDFAKSLSGRLVYKANIILRRRLWREAMKDVWDD